MQWITISRKILQQSNFISIFYRLLKINRVFIFLLIYFYFPIILGQTIVRHEQFWKFRERIRRGPPRLPCREQNCLPWLGWQCRHIEWEPSIFIGERQGYSLYEEGKGYLGYKGRQGYLVYRERQGYLVYKERQGYLVCRERQGYLVNKEGQGYLIQERQGYLVYKARQGYLVFCYSEGNVTA